MNPLLFVDGMDLGARRTISETVSEELIELCHNSEASIPTPEWEDLG